MGRYLSPQSGVKLYIGKGKRDWIEIFPDVEEIDYGVDARVITITGTFLLTGRGPDTWYLRKLVPTAVPLRGEEEVRSA